LRRLLALWLIAALVIGLAAYGIFTFARREVVQHQWGLLEAIANDREAVIAGWINDRRDEALRFVDNPAYTAAVARLLAHEAPGAAWTFFRRDIDVLLDRPHYEAIALLTPDGKIERAFGGSTEALGGLQSVSFSSTERISFHEVIVGKAPHREIRILMVAPVWSSDRYVGALAFAIQPYLEVGPVLSTWPWPDSTTEVLVFHHLADEILYLTPPRDSPEPVLIVKANPSFLATQAASRSGRLTGLDYQGEEVVGVARQISGTPWHLLVKISRSELRGLVTNLGLFAGGLSLLLIGLAGLLVYSRFYQLQAQHRSALLQAEVDKSALSRRFDYLAKYANDIIILTDKDGRILEANDRAIEAYGYTRDELLSRSFFDLLAPEEAASAEMKWAVLRQQQSAIFEGIHRKKDGDRFFVESSLRLIDIRGEIFVQDIMRDISERKKADARIRQLNRLYLTLSRTNEAILYHHREKDLLIKACDIAVSEGGFFASWAMTVSADGRCLDILTYCGPGEKEYRETMKPPVTEIARGATASTLAIREGRSIHINDYFNDPRMTAMHNWAIRTSGGSAAALPIYVEGNPYGVIGVYANELNAFDSEVVSLLERMASDLGFALRNLRQSNALTESEERARCTLARLFANASVYRPSL
jgi:PAS domain S-box-containing protein